jgi:threonine aldolase
MDPRDVAAAIRTDSPLSPRMGLVLVEQTHMDAGGTVLPLSNLREIAEAARASSLPVHMDGARLFNAAVASGVEASEYAACADSVSFSLVKGLCCPAGSVLCGPADFVARARRVVRAFGGGWRQAGYFAACGLWALDHLVARLAEDHALAYRLAEGLASIPGVEVDLAAVQTNLVFARVSDARALVDSLASRGILASAFEGERVRFVTHRDVGEADVAAALSAASEALR